MVGSVVLLEAGAQRLPTCLPAEAGEASGIRGDAANAACVAALTAPECALMLLASATMVLNTLLGADDSMRGVLNSPLDCVDVSERGVFSSEKGRALDVVGRAVDMGRPRNLAAATATDPATALFEDLSFPGPPPPSAAVVAVNEGHTDSADSFGDRVRVPAAVCMGGRLMFAHLSSAGGAALSCGTDSLPPSKLSAFRKLPSVRRRGSFRASIWHWSAGRKGEQAHGEQAAATGGQPNHNQRQCTAGPHTLNLTLIISQYVSKCHNNLL